MCKIPVQLNGDVLAAYLSAYGSVEEMAPVKAADGTAYADYHLNVCLNREGFQFIPHILHYKDQQMMVVVEVALLGLQAVRLPGQNLPSKDTI